MLQFTVISNPVGASTSKNKTETAPVWCTLTLPCLCSVDSEAAPPDGSGTVQWLLQTRADQWRTVDGVWRSPTGARTWDKVTTTSCKITKIHKRTIIYANTSWRTVNFFTVSIIRFEVMLCITLIMLLPNCCTYFYSAINLAIFLCIVYLFSGHYPAIICQLPTKLCNSPLYIISLCLLFLKVNINSKFP